MRKIERQMNQAITDKVNFKSANTEVQYLDGISYVYLHGNKIAEVGDGFIRLYDGGYQSTTTKSRLNAFLQEHGLPGESVFQKAYTWFAKLYTGNGQFTVVPFFSSMRLA
jgi:hypothetical protein